jgi:cytochrome c-type biogenesis protein CcmH/NrfF
VRDRHRGGILLVGLLLLAPAGAARGEEAAVPQAEREANALKRVSQHLICQCGCNMVLSECSHQSCGFALPERARIVADLKAGKSDQEILDGYIAAFGPGIRATPPTRGSLRDRFAWLAPGLALLCGLVLVSGLLHRMTRPRVTAGSADPAPAAADPYLERVERELDGKRGA